MASTVLQAYLLPALTAVSTIPLISASLDHPLALWTIVALLIHSLSHSILQPSIYLFSPSLSFSLCDSLCVVGQKLLQGEGVFLLRVDGVPPAAGEADPRVVLGQLGHIPRVCHHLERRKSATNSVQQLNYHAVYN